MGKEISNFSFEMMPEINGMVRFSDRIVMYDNLDTPMNESISNYVKSFVGILPKKLTFAIILLCDKGHIEIDCNLRNLSVNAGGLIVLVPGTIVERLDISLGTSLIVLAVPDQDYAPSNSFVNATYSQKNFTSPIALQLDDEVRKSGIESYRQLKDTIKTMGDTVTNDLVKAYIMVMAGLAAVNLQKWVITHPEEKKHSKETILKNFLNNVEKEHREHRDVTYYADKEGISPKYFAKVIFSTSGKRPLDWIRDYVILDAKAMLKSGEFTIGQICGMLNFKPQSLFNRYFKDATGMTPMEYMKSK